MNKKSGVDSEIKGNAEGENRHEIMRAVIQNYKRQQKRKLGERATVPQLVAAEASRLFVLHEKASQEISSPWTSAWHRLDADMGPPQTPRKRRL